MSPLQLHFNTSKVATRTVPSGEKQRQTSKTLHTQEWTCLVLSLDKARLEQLRSTAQSSGWRPLLCGSVAEAIQEDERWRSQFYLIDLAPDERGLRESVFHFVERLSNRPEPLVMVCDDQPTPEAEIWARKLGVWLYLPEPSLGEELIQLCAEAMRISRSRRTDTPAPANA